MKILYICTHNRCRSILSEAITNHLAGNVISAKSAGSQPANKVHPLTLKYLEEKGYPVQNLHCQSWHDLADFTPDLVITVCDTAADEACPVWLDKTPKVHWGLNDPSKTQGSDTEKEHAFTLCIEEIVQRTNQLKSLIEQYPDPNALNFALVKTGEKQHQ